MGAVIDWIRANKQIQSRHGRGTVGGDLSVWVGGVQPLLDGVTHPLKDQVHSLVALFDSALSFEVAQP